MPSRKIDDLQVTITSAGVELAQDGVGVVRLCSMLQLTYQANVGLGA